MKYIFADSIMHRDCFNSHPDRYVLRDHLKEVIEPDDIMFGWLFKGIDDYFDETFPPDEEE